MPHFCYAALLVEFAEVVEIVDVVAVAVGRAGFATRRQPDIGDTNVLVCGHRIVQAGIVLAISRDIPLKALKQSVVLGSRFFCAHVDE